MKNLTVVSLSLALAFGLVTPAIANVRAELEAKRQEIQAKIRENQDKLRGVKEEFRSSGQDSRKSESNFRFDIARHRALVAVKLFEATVERLEKLTVRIESRTAKFNAAGASTTEVANFVNLAKTNIADAKTHISLLRSLDVSTSTNSTTTAMMNWDNVKSEAKIVRELLTDAKQNLQKAVNALARLNKQYRPEDNATSTATTTATSTP